MFRRDLLLATSGMFMSSLASRAFAAPAQATQGKPPARAKSVIVLWMNGGPSHLDTWDPKPGTRNGGPTKALKTRVPGLEISAEMPRIAEVSQHLCVLRSMSSKEGNHQRAQYLGRTSYSPNPTIEHPSLGAWISKKFGPTASGLPAFMSLGGPSVGPGFFGAQHGPFVVQKAGVAPDNAVAAVSAPRLERRLALLDDLEKRFAARLGGRVVEERQAVYRGARQFMMSPDLSAFDLTQSKDAAAPYGDTDFGRACFTALNLVRAGVRLVEVTLDGWDTHEDNFGRVNKQLAILDPAMSALLSDLVSTHDTSGRPLIESTMVLWMGDFGRNPRINGREGRDHHPQAWSAVLAGAGIKPGVVGATDANGEKPVGKSFGTADLLATVASTLGISPSEEAISPIGRPIAVTDSGVPIGAARAD